MQTHVGTTKDKLRPNAWPYRDYVIRSFNEDKRYSRFVQEQIAGDALFPNEPDGILGLGFIAAGNRGTSLVMLKCRNQKLTAWWRAILTETENGHEHAEHFLQRDDSVCSVSQPQV